MSRRSWRWEKRPSARLQNLSEEETRVRRLRDRFEKTIVESVDGTSINGAGASRLPNTSNLSFDGIESHAALILLDRQRICCSAGSLVRPAPAMARMCSAPCTPKIGPNAACVSRLAGSIPSPISIKR